MKIAPRLALVVALLAVLPGVALPAHAEDAPSSAQNIDLPTALQLAGAQNIDVAIAREKLAQAEAEQLSARLKFLPWIVAGGSWNRHTNEIQNVEGEVIEADKQSYAGSAAVRMQVDLGAAWFASLSAHQVVRAATSAIDAANADAVASVATAYFELLAAGATVDVRRQAERNWKSYEDELHRAVGIGVAYRGDELRVRVIAERAHLSVLDAENQRRTAAARLSELLHLDSTVDLLPRSEDLAPISLIDASASLDSLVSQSLESRPELKQAEANVEAARRAKDGAVYGPLVPNIGALASAGGLEGGPDGGNRRGGDSQDYAAGLSWRIGPGGLLDPAPVRAAASRLREAELVLQRQKDRIAREVVESHTRAHSLVDQLAANRQILADATESYDMASQRKEYAVGLVLETIQAQEELVRARESYVQAIASWDKAQYALKRAVGALPATSSIP